MEIKTNSQPVFLEGETVILRPREKRTDLDACLRWVNDPDLRGLITPRPPVTREQEEAWFDQHQSDDISLAIERRADRRLIGMIDLHRLNRDHRFATSGTFIGEKDCWGQGFGTEAKQLLLEYAFLDLGLRQVRSHVYATNKRSLRCQLKCGYRIVGRFPAAYFLKGAWVDEVLLCVTREEWLARFPHRFARHWHEDQPDADVQNLAKADGIPI